MFDSLLTVSVFAASGALFFFAGARWGSAVIDWIGGPMSGRYLVAGQKWHLPGVGMVKVVSVWPECVLYYSTKEGPDFVHVMNREDFNNAARDEKNRDPKGRFRLTKSERILKFEAIDGGKRDTK